MYMRLIAALILLSPFIPGTGQSAKAKKITLEEAVSEAILNNPSLTSGFQKKVLVAEVETVYFNQVYQISRYKILQQQAGLLHDIERVANLRFETGDIDLLERSTMINRIAKIRAEISMLDDELAISGNKLKLLLLSPDDLVPADSALSLYAIQKGTSPAGSEPSAPLLPDYKRENLEFELNKYFKKILYFQQVALARADILIGISQIRFEKEDIDYTEFVQNAEEGFLIRLEYMQTLNIYNQTAIQLELYAY
jgi:hypothetical protein